MVSALELGDLYAMSDSEVQAAYDAAAKHTEVGAQYFINELARRALARQTDALQQSTDALVDYTRQLRNMTWVITVFGVITGLLTLVLVYKIFMP